MLVYYYVTLLLLTSPCLEDDAAEVARERVALLEFSQSAVNLMEFTRVMAEQLQRDQEGLDLAEESMAQTRETTRQVAPSLNLQKIIYKTGLKMGQHTPRIGFRETVFSVPRLKR